MEVTVHCPCGQDYAFDVEPVDGRMPCTINCPGCAADGTELANAVIAQSQSQPAAVPVQAAAPAGLRINRPAPAAATATAPTAPPPQKVFTRAMTEGPSEELPETSENIPMGILGGVIAGSIAMVAWYFLTLAVDREFGIMAWFVGVIAGIGVRKLGRDATALLGVVAAICACLAILGGKFLVTSHYLNKIVNTQAQTAYTEELDAAKEGLKAKSDQEVKDWLKKHDEIEGEISAQDITKFRETRQGELQDFVNGKPSRQDFEKPIRATLNTFNFKYMVFKETISLFTVLWLCFGIASAYRIASN